MSFSKVALTLASVVGAQSALKALSRWDLNDALGVVGLERQHRAADRALPLLGLVVASAAVGAGAALLFAPTTGADLRHRISGRVDDAKNRLNDKIREFEQHAEHSANSVTS